MEDPGQSAEKEMDIYLKVIKTVALKVKGSDTIRKLKAKFREKEGVSECLQELYYSGEWLGDDRKLIDCGIQSNSPLHLYLQNSEVIKLFVSIISKRKTVEVEAKSVNTIKSIKSMIQAKEEIQSDLFSLLYAGMLLEDEMTLTSLGIKGRSTLQLILNPRDVLSVSVRMPSGEIVKLEVKALYTVGDVKALVGSMLGSSLSDHCLAYAGKKLEDSKTLAFYNVQQVSILEMWPPFSFQIFVKNWSGGKTMTLNVNQKHTITDLKDMIFLKLRVPEDKYFLVFAGKSLADDRDMASYGIGNQSTLFMSQRLSAISVTILNCMKLENL